MAAMTCVSLRGGAGFSYAREMRSIVAVLLFCVDEPDCMTVLSVYNSISRGDCFELIGPDSGACCREPNPFGGGVVDAFGRASARLPEKPHPFPLSRARAPECVEAEDILEFELDGTPIDAGNQKPYLGRFIHGAIYEARP
jgi:hypothetical protein